jgi:hypothetical protein
MRQNLGMLITIYGGIGLLATTIGTLITMGLEGGKPIHWQTVRGVYVAILIPTIVGAIMFLM